MTPAAADTIEPRRVGRAHHYSDPSRDGIGGHSPPCVTGSWSRRVMTTGCIIVACLAHAGAILADEQPRAVPTFHSVGLYWSPQDGSARNVCAVRYRPAGAGPWRQGLPLWFDEREAQEALPAEHSRQYRGSLVNLTPGTEYEIELSLQDTGRRASLRARTWGEDLPIAGTVTVRDGAAPLVIDNSGTPGGYTLYTHPPDTETATIDVQNGHAQCLEVRASYIIIRGLTLKNAREHGIRLFEGCHDVIVEDCDISGWGRVSDDGWGRNLDSAVYSNAKDLTRVVVQRNRIHHPRGDSNNWRENRPRPGKRESYHPEGPQAVYFANSEGNHVIRYNTVWSDDDHQYNDVFGAASNFSVRGFPNRDSDIYGNLLSHCWDDAIESEGANCNVRIWGNYTTECYVSVACASTSIGPLYVWRNVSDVMRVAPCQWGGGFLKTSDKMAGGRVFAFHNTILQPARMSDGKEVAAGARVGLGWGGPMVNVTSRNNILQVTSVAISDRARDPHADYDYDLYQGRLQTSDPHEQHGIRGEPIYVEDAGLKDGAGRFQLVPTGPGFDAGARLPNFNDDYTGQGPDVGAHEAGTAAMEFGVNAGKTDN